MFYLVYMSVVLGMRYAYYLLWNLQNFICYEIYFDVRYVKRKALRFWDFSYWEVNYFIGQKFEEQKSIWWKRRNRFWLFFQYFLSRANFIDFRYFKEKRLVVYFKWSISFSAIVCSVMMYISFVGWWVFKFIFRLSVIFGCLQLN